MNTYKKILLSASVLVASISTASAASALTIDFSGLVQGSSISNQYAAQDLNIAAVTTGNVSTAASIASGWPAVGVSNAPASSSGNYPTDEFLSFSFTSAVNNLSFDFSNWGSNGDGVTTGSNYIAYGVGNSIISTGNLSNTDNQTLVNVAGANITKLVLDNSFTDTFTSSGGNSWEFGVGQISYNVSSVPLPAGLPMFGAALFGMFGLSRRKTVAAVA